MAHIGWSQILATDDVYC